MIGAEIVVGWIFATPTHACDETLHSTDLDAIITEAHQHLEALDADSFQTAVQRARAVVACVKDPIPAGTVAALHRIVGIRAFSAREPLAEAAFAAARRIEPGYELPRAQFPPDSPLAEVYAAFDLDGLRTVVLDVPPNGWVTLDGRADLTLAPDLPVVYQHFIGGGTAVSSGYALPGEPIPGLTPAAPAARRKRRPGVPLAIAAGAAGLLGASTWGLAAHGRSRYLSLTDPVPDDQLAGLRTRTNALVLISGGSFAIGAALGVTSAAAW